jgi:hypothetical protein
VFGPYFVVGLGTLGCVLSGALRNWPERTRYRFALGVVLGTGGTVTAWAIYAARYGPRFELSF